MEMTLHGSREVDQKSIGKRFGKNHNEIRSLMALKSFKLRTQHQFATDFCTNSESLL